MTVCQKMVYIKKHSKLKQLKALLVAHNQVSYFIHGKLITGHGLDLQFNTLQGLNNIFTEFDNVHICEGLRDPALLSVVSHPLGNKKSKYWRSKDCSLYYMEKNRSGKAICVCCEKLWRSLKNRVTAVECESLRQNKLTATRTILQNRRDIISRKIATIQVR